MISLHDLLIAICSSYDVPRSSHPVPTSNNWRFTEGNKKARSMGAYNISNFN